MSFEQAAPNSLSGRAMVAVSAAALAHAGVVVTRDVTTNGGATSSAAVVRTRPD